MNGDHALDVATVNQDASTVSVLLNKGHGAFRPRRDYATAEDNESDPESLAIGDLNGDRRPDLVTANAFESTVSVLRTGRRHVPDEARLPNRIQQHTSMGGD